MGGLNGRVTHAFFTLTEITSDGDHAAYNEWHQLDHQPEQFTIEGVVHGQRWVLSPACRPAVAAESDLLLGSHYFTLYLMQGPRAEVLREFYDLAELLRRAGRFYPHRRAVLGGSLLPTGAAVRPGLELSPEVLPFRPGRGVVVVVGMKPVGSDSVGPAVPALDVLVRHEAISGGWSFVSAEPVGGRAVSDDKHPGGAASSAMTPRFAYRAAKPDGDIAHVTVLYVDDDPVEAAELVAGDLDLPGGRRTRDVGCDGGGSTESRTNNGRIAFAGPFETITAWEWTWFDKP